MSVSFYWEIVKPFTTQTLSAGTSSDVDVLANVFGECISTKDIPKLQAMHAATHYEKSLWLEIVRTLERLQGEDYDKKVRIKVWAGY